MSENCVLFAKKQRNSFSFLAAQKLLVTKGLFENYHKLVRRNSQFIPEMLTPNMCQAIFLSRTEMTLDL